MAKARIWGKSDDGSEEAKGVIAIACPGCNEEHIIATKVPFGNGAVWSFNGDFERPTFSPSLLVNQDINEDGQRLGFHRCHSFITDGKIQFLSDCTHHLKGQTVDLPDIH